MSQEHGRNSEPSRHAAPPVEAEFWRPHAAFEMLRARAQMLSDIRTFFAARGVLEVETPMLSRAAATDPALTSMRLMDAGYWLHTSPEFPMKRLLAAGLGPIYQICRVFRGGERGRLHHPEFTLLEWYRPGWTWIKLMDEVADLVRHLLGRPQLRSETLAYRTLFQRELDVDPWQCTPPDLRAVALAQGIDHQLRLDLDAWLDLLLTHCLEAQLGQHGLTFLYGYPPSQAALARLSADDPPHAERFELYFQGVELANGYQELTDASEQGQRFTADLNARREAGLTAVISDQHLLNAMRAGLPECAGVALGVDRLLMLAVGASHIDDVLAFPIERA